MIIEQNNGRIYLSAFQKEDNSYLVKLNYDITYADIKDIAVIENALKNNSSANIRIYGSTNKVSGHVDFTGDNLEEVMKEAITSYSNTFKDIINKQKSSLKLPHGQQPEENKKKGFLSMFRGK